ncbi:MAG: hypothetical protein R2854_00680 [Caldilineaceae bacterium]
MRWAILGPIIGFILLYFILRFAVNQFRADTLALEEFPTATLQEVAVNASTEMTATTTSTTTEAAGEAAPAAEAETSVVVTTTETVTTTEVVTGPKS